MTVKYRNERSGSSEHFVIAFPGQGAQSRGMGKELFERYPAMVKAADDILGYSIQDLCQNDPLNVLGNTRFTQPAIYVVSALEYKKAMEEGLRKPDYLLGHSLGEYNALQASGMIDFETGLKLVKKRGELMSKILGGSMAAVLNLPVGRIEQILRDSGMGERVTIANYNTPLQSVLAGPVADINQLKAVFEAEGGRYSILRVSGAFHSKYMNQAGKEFAQFLKEEEFQTPEIPVISNYTAREYLSGHIREYLLEQLVHPVKWTESISYLMSLGSMEFLQIGPGAVVARLIETIVKMCPPPVSDRKEPEGRHCSLGSRSFREEFGVKYSYAVGGMSHGITSHRMIEKLCSKKILGFLGFDGVSPEKSEMELRLLKQQGFHQFGVNFVNPISDPALEERYFQLLYQYGISVIEVSSYIKQTDRLVEYRLKGLTRSEDGRILGKNRILVKTFRPETAENFLCPPDNRLVQLLLTEGRITAEEAELSRKIPMATGICIETGRETDIGLSSLLMQKFQSIRQKHNEKNHYELPVYIGQAGGLGTPEAVACAFRLGSDFVETGSINQCTVESPISDAAKDILNKAGVLDTVHVPSKQLFEWGGKTRAVKKGTFFPYRANKLYELYTQFENLADLPPKWHDQLENSFFCKSLTELIMELYGVDQKEAGQRMFDKETMAAVFKKYLDDSMEWAVSGDERHKNSYCICCTPAMGAFNEWASGREFYDWRSRHVDFISELLMNEAQEIIMQESAEEIG